MVLLPSLGSTLTVRVHPVALFSICDAYIRRDEKQERVIGTLLGVVADNVMEVKNCYVVPHQESSDQVALDISHHKAMYELHARVAPQDVIIGWFATGPVLYNSDALIQTFYTSENASAIHLLVDTTLADGKFNVKAFVSRGLALGDKAVASEFMEVPCEVLFGGMEKVAVDLASERSIAAKAPLSDAEALAGSVKRLQGLLDNLLTYVDDVVEGRRSGDPTVGRYLADTVAIVPHLSKVDFEGLFNESVQDSLMVTYLSNLIRSHISLAEKLGTSQLPIL